MSGVGRRRGRARQERLRREGADNLGLPEASDSNETAQPLSVRGLDEPDGNLDNEQEMITPPEARARLAQARTIPTTSSAALVEPSWANFQGFRPTITFNREFYNSKKSGRVEDWLHHVRMYCEHMNIPEGKRTFFAAQYLHGDAEAWFTTRTRSDLHALDDWNVFVDELVERFWDENEELRTHEQLNKMEHKSKEDISAFNQRFTRLYMQVQGSITEEVATYIYTFALQPRTKLHVQQLRPKGLKEAMSAAELHEGMLNEMYKQRSKQFDRRTTIRKDIEQAGSSQTRVRSQQMNLRTMDTRDKNKVDQYRREKGLCYGCGSADHKRKDCPHKSRKE